MGLFSKPEVVIARESTNAKVYLEKLEELLPEAEDEVKEKIQREIAVTKAGIHSGTGVDSDSVLLPGGNQRRTGESHPGFLQGMSLSGYSHPACLGQRTAPHGTENQ